MQCRALCCNFCFVTRRDESVRGQDAGRQRHDRGAGQARALRARLGSGRRLPLPAVSCRWDCLPAHEQEPFTEPYTWFPGPAD